MFAQRQPAMEKSLQRRIDDCFDELRPSEQIVASHLKTLAGQRFDQSITELAKTIGVSEATVSRFSRALGFAGFADLKLSMAAEQGRGSFPNIPADLRSSDTVGEIAAKLGTVLARSLADTQQQLEHGKLETAVQMILDARRVVFMGVGGAAAICEEATHIFLKIGVDATSYSDGYTQTIVASTLQADCLLIAVSHTGATPSVVAAVQVARQNGVRTLAITGDASSALGQAADIVFATTQGGEKAIPLHGDFLEGRISQLYLVDVLYIAVMFRLKDVAQDRLAQTTLALANHYGMLVPAERSSPAVAKGSGKRTR